MKRRSLVAVLTCGALACGARAAPRAPAPSSATQTIPPSCAPGGPGMTDCGVARDSCCASLEVPGGTFFLIYGPHYADDGGLTSEMTTPMTVSTFRLDKYDVTVGRFRQFVAAWRAGYRPASGSGKHAHLNGGLGLVATNSDGAYEPGWSSDRYVDPTDKNLACGAAATWTPAPGRQENLPINCVNWWESQAFCIWDGGFLPSDAELGYAEAGGNEQRHYPWGAADPGVASEYAFFDCHYPLGITANCNVVKADDYTAANIAPVGMLPRGAGRWGQLDLEGNVDQRTLDQRAVEPCKDCGYWPVDRRSVRGTDYRSEATSVHSWDSGPFFMWEREDSVGFRCARMP